MHSFNFALWSFLASISAVRAVKNITVDDFDPRIVYSDPSVWIHENDGATLDRFNLTTSYTGQQALASFKFNGTAIYFMSYGLPLPYPDTYQVTLDGQSQTRSLRVSNDSERAKFIAYSHTGLDISTEHVITISNPQMIPLNIDAFIVTVPDDSTMKDGFSPVSQTGTSDANSNPNSGLTTAAKAGIAVGVICGVLFVLLVALGIIHLRRQKISTARSSPSDPAGKMERGDNSAVQPQEIRYSANVTVSPYVGPAGGFQRQQDGHGQDAFRKDRRPVGVTYRTPDAWFERDEDATTSSGITSPLPLPSSPSVIAPPPYVG